jgi:HEAT repeat protein
MFTIVSRKSPVVKTGDDHWNMKSLCYAVATAVTIGFGVEPCMRAGEVAFAADLWDTVSAAAQYQSGQSLEPLRRIEEAVRQSAGKPSARRGVEVSLIGLLGTNATFEARKFACTQLGIIGSTAALPALEALLQEDETVGLACLALSTYPRGKADDLLRAAVKFSKGAKCVQILNTLGDRRDEQSVSVLIGRTGDADRAVAEAAIASLGKLGSAAALRGINAVHTRDVPELKAAVTEARLRCADRFAAAGDVKAAELVYEELLTGAENPAVRRSALAALLPLDTDGGLRRILKVLASTNNFLKPVAIGRIPSVPGERATEKFAAAMHNLSSEHQALLIDSLAARKDAVARLELAKALSLPDPAVRREAIVALGRLGDPYFVSLLARAAGSGDVEEARAVETALVSLRGGAETDKRLVAELKNALPKARVALIAALARRQGSAANETLLEEVDNSDPAVAKAALRALAKTGGPDEAAPLLTKMATLHDAGVRSEAESTARQILGKIDNTGRRSSLVKQALGRATVVENRIVLIGLLPACGDGAALLMAIKALSDPESQVRDAALRALTDWPDDSAWSPLLVVYRRPENENARGVACTGLVRLLGEQNAHPDAALFARYKDLLAACHSTADLKQVLGALSGAADPAALELIMPLLSNSNVHAEAAAAANRIAEAIKAQHPAVAEDTLKRLTAPR